MLSHHPQIAWCTEFEYAVDQISDNGTFPKLNDYYRWLETNRLFQVTGLKIDPALNYCQLVNSFLYQQQQKSQSLIIGATVHRHFDRLLYIWPDARFVHLVRDGRDVARSCIHMGWAGNVWVGTERWLEAEQLWDKLKSQLPSDRYVEVVYEDLIAQPKAVLTQLCHFFGTEYDAAMLSYPQDTSYDLPDVKYIQQWKNKLSNREIRLIESRIGGLLQSRDYLLSDLPSLTVTPLMAQQLRLQNWGRRVLFRIRRYGLPLFLAEFVFRKLHLKPWCQNVRLKTDVIDRGYIK